MVIGPMLDVAEKYHPGFRDSIRAAEDWEIEDLEDLAGPLPATYLEFLRVMGASLGELRIREASLDIEVIRSGYRMDCAEKDGRYVFIAQDFSLADSHYFLDRETPFGDGDCMVVRKSFRADVAVPGLFVHAGLEELLYYEAFRSFRVLGFEHIVDLATMNGAELSRGAADLCRPRRAFRLRAHFTE